MKKYKYDIILVFTLLAVAVIALFVVNKFIYKKGAFVEIYSDSELIETLALDKNTEYEIKTGDSLNVFQIEDGFVFMKHADCPDKLCEKQGKISRGGETIVCLPNKIVVKIKSEQENAGEIDAKAR